MTAFAWGLTALLAAATAAEPGHVTLKGPRDLAGSAEDHVVPEDMGGPMLFDPEVYQGAAQLGLERDFVQHVRIGLELLYEGEYTKSQRWFDELQAVYPDSGVDPVSDVLVYQARMMENFDYRYEAQWEEASRRARAELAAAGRVPGHEGWEALMMTVVSGVDAIHAARRGRYLPALALAFEAVDWIETTRANAPRFLDLALADGLYNYWRSALTMKSRLLPDFTDKRAEGMAQVDSVVTGGIFLAAPARLARSFSWFEEKRYDKARDDLLANQLKYPKNVINTLMLGLAQVYTKEYDVALATFDRVLALRPDHQRVHYYRGIALQRDGKPKQAEASFRTYLAFSGLESSQAGGAWYRLGQTLEKQKRWAEAYEAHKTAIKVSGDGRAKEAIERMKEKRKKGEISF